MNPKIKLTCLSVYIFPEQAACNSTANGCADYTRAEDAITDAIQQLTKALSDLKDARAEQANEQT